MTELGRIPKCSAEIGIVDLPRPIESNQWRPRTCMRLVPRETPRTRTETTALRYIEVKSSSLQGTGQPYSGPIRNRCGVLQCYPLYLMSADLSPGSPVVDGGSWYADVETHGQLELHRLISIARPQFSGAHQPIAMTREMKKRHTEQCHGGMRC
jgi:hypothetical protein